MEKLKMQSFDGFKNNYEILVKLFPNCLSEKIIGYDDNGKAQIERAIDVDMLRQEINCELISGNEERYQFTWPDKRKAIITANSPITETLRPCSEESVNFDKTENVYIEGDNLEVLKLLQETYLGKVKLIYIDPPYNTGHDFVYNDDYSEDIDEYLEKSGQFDELGNRMFQNTENNGRFHTDWLNMMYPRLKVAKNLLSEDGLIFISIGDEEVDNLRKLMDEIFGEANFRNQIIVRRGAKSVQAQFDTWDKLGQGVEYLLLYSKSSDYRFSKQMKPLDEKKDGGWNNHWRGTDRPTMRYELFGITPESGQWRWSKERSYVAIENYNRMLKETGYNGDTVVPQNIIDKWYCKQEDKPDLLRLSINNKPEHYIAPTSETLLNNTWYDLLVGSSSEISQLFDSKVFDTAKLTAVIKRMIKFTDSDAIILDFFSGSATTAHAVMEQNAEDNGTRKFIMVQIPDKTDEKSEAYRAGYKNICEIGKERIRRVGKKIKENNKQVDIGFRVFKVDSSNMVDVYYTPKEFNQASMFSMSENIKSDRTSEDLLFQVMLDLGVLLSSKIEKELIAGKSVFSVADGFLIACFDIDVSEETVTEIAKKKPYYAVFRDSGIATDSVATNFDQIFVTYSPDTVRRIL